MSNVVKMTPQDDTRVEKFIFEKMGDSTSLDMHCSTATLVDILEECIQTLLETDLVPQEIEILNGCLTRAQVNLDKLVLSTSNWV